MDWDLTPYFPQFRGAEMRAFQEDLARRLSDLRARLARAGRLRRNNLADWAGLVGDYEEAHRRHGHLASYLSCLCAADARNEDYAAEDGALAAVTAELEKVITDLKLALAEASPALFESLLRRPALRGLEFPLRMLRREAEHRMSPAEETLTADLAVDGLHAWGRLYQVMSGRQDFEMHWPDGRVERVSLSRRNSLMASADRRVREAAFRGSNVEFGRQEHIFAAALNAIAGTRRKLDARRGVPHFLDNALRQARLERPVLEAMFSAIRDNLELPRRLLRWRAQALGLPAVSYFDLAAPLEFPGQRPLPWADATRLCESSFRAAYPRLADYFRHMLEQRWIDHRPRAGKRPGGFCTGSDLIDQTRIYMTYQDTLNDLRTLAHEAGHAWHSHLLQAVRPEARLYPMTLAECASTFAEQILAKGIVDSPDFSPGEKGALLDSQVGHAAVFLMDLPVRFFFEERLYEERAAGELSPSRLRELMVETQRRHFGDTLAEGGEDPWFWASKLHFYLTDIHFYNFPYTFGFLLSASLYRRWQEEGPGFLNRYEQFLLRTGSADCRTVVRETLGEDIAEPAFWARAIHGLEEPFAALRQAWAAR